MLTNQSIVVVGSEGYIGSHLSNHIKKHFGSVLDISHTSKIMPLELTLPETFDYNKLKGYEYIIFTSAISSPDVCESNYNMAYEINVEGTKYFIQHALDCGCKIIFFSSDAVFGFSPKIVSEDSPTNSQTAYGAMKKEIEDIFKESKDFKAIRLSYVFSQNDKYTKYLLKCRDDKECAKIFHPFYRNCISLDEVIYVIVWLIENWETFKSPFLNVCGKELISRLRIADEINRLTGTDIRYEVKFPGKDFYINRPAILEMHSLFLKDILVTYNESFSCKVERQLINIIKEKIK